MWSNASDNVVYKTHTRLPRVSLVMKTDLFWRTFPEQEHEGALELRKAQKPLCKGASISNPGCMFSVHMAE
jgi:hypothetical protein